MTCVCRKHQFLIEPLAVSLFFSAQIMASVVCCATLEVKHRKRGGGCKVLNDTSIQVSDMDLYLNGKMRKSNLLLHFSKDDKHS